MANFHDPALASTDEWGMVTLWHAFYGLFLWEFFTTLDYEWSVFLGHISYRWTIWIYSLTRIASLMCVILGIIEMDIMTSAKCQLWASFTVTFSYLSLASASLLIVLRIIAIWNPNKVAMVMAIGVWGINAVFLIEGAARLRSEWVPAILTCVANTSSSNIATVISVPVTDIILILMMLVGLLRLRHNGGGTFDLAQLLWKQGVIWILLATVAEILPAVLLALNLNNQFKYIFQLPAVLTMAVAATRMHRSLVHFTHGTSEPVHENFQSTGFKFTTITPRATQIPLTQIEITTHSVSEQHPTLILTDDHGLAIDVDQDVRMKSIGSCIDEDVERGHVIK